MKYLLLSSMLAIACYTANAQTNITRIRNFTECPVWVYVYCYEAPCSGPPVLNLIDRVHVLPMTHPQGGVMNVQNCGNGCAFYPGPPPVPYCAQAYNVEFEYCPDPATRLTNVISGTVPSPCGLPYTSIVTDNSCCDPLKPAYFDVNSASPPYSIDIFH